MSGEREANDVREPIVTVRDLVAVLGLALVMVGLAMVYRPLGLTAGGLILLWHTGVLRPVSRDDGEGGAT